MQPLLYPVSLQRIPAFSNLSIRFCAVLALEYDSGQKYLSPLCPKYCRENSYDYKDILDAVRKIRMRGARHINFDQIKVALEMRDAKPLVFTDSQRTDDFLEIELGSEDVLSQLDSIMQSNAERRNRL